MQLLFVANWEGSPIDAARKAGFKHAKEASCRVMKIPAVRKAIEEKQRKAISVAGARLGKQLAKSDVLERLIKLADIEPFMTNNNITGQVNALKTVAEIEGFIIRKTEDINKTLAGKTEAEKEFFVANGYWPDRPNVDTNESGPLGSESPSTAGHKPN